MSTTSPSAWEIERSAALRALVTALQAFAAKKLYWVERRRRRKAIRKAYAQRKRQLIAESYKAGRELIAAAKQNKPCTDCGLFVPGHMSFDHLPGHRKQFDLGNSKHRTPSQIKRELAKCELVCCLCHDRRERARGSRSGHTCRAGKDSCPLYAAKPWINARRRGL